MSADLTYHVVDVFTDRAYAGNPLAVVLDGDDLTTAQMQAVAREFNLSETTFVLPPTTAEATYRVRIFTPAAELPFAGHPSVGTAWLLARLGRIPIGDVVQECGAGLLPVVVDEAGATLTGGAPTVSDEVPAAAVAEALGLSSLDYVGTPVRWCGCGIEFAYLHVDDEALPQIVPDLGRLAELGNAGVCAFSFDGTSAHSRVFAAGVGVPEDPATGSAALGLGVFLVASGLLPGEGETSFDIRQGIEMGRPSRLSVRVDASGGQVTRATVTGGVFPVATGSISPPA
jgi:trans-2,3-dihydro-3-hydroxyanthranilate isomerase